MKKLVRDKVPDIIGATRQFEVERVNGNTYKSYLRKKVIEEEKELWAASLADTEFPSEHRTDVKEEAADLITVVLALCNAHGLCWEEVEEEIVRKGKEKGGFGGGFVMEFSK